MTRRDEVSRAVALARERIRELFAAALRAVEPASAVRATLAARDGSLVVGDVILPMLNGVHVVAVGKAAVAMTHGALDVLGTVVLSGVVITKEGHVEEPLPEFVRVHEAGHPIPDERGVEATQSALAALHRLPTGAIVLALISGGGSALLEAPRDGLTLGDFQETTDLLLRAGAPIEALNAVRRPLSRVKAGGLRAAAPHATWVTLILSDVLGNDPRIIASGPTVPGASDAMLALEIIDRYGVRDQMPAAVLTALAAERSDDRMAYATKDVVRVVGDNAVAVAAAAEEARALRLHPEVIWSAMEGEAATLGSEWVGSLARAPEPVDVLLGGGEATVTVRGDGQGGRNTEFALAAALALEQRGRDDWVVASLATDGQDAMTGWAGAIADADTCLRARERGVDPVTALGRNDSLAVFAAAGGAVKTGPTGTNVNDLYVAVRTRRLREASHREGV
jgi:hydroxypyruvate reductase